MLPHVAEIIFWEAEMSAFVPAPVPDISSVSSSAVFLLSCLCVSNALSCLFANNVRC